MAKAARPTSGEEFAYGRSNEASKAAYELCKVIAQSCLLINGGAATAVLALLAKDKVDANIIAWVPFGLAGYAIGVVISAFMLFCVMMMADNWNYFWYYYSLEKDVKSAEECEELANKWHVRMNRCFGAAIGCFAIASIVVAIGMYLSLPTSTIPPKVVFVPQTTPGAPSFLIPATPSTSPTPKN